MALSTKSDLYIEWTESSESEVPVEGYMLYMSEGLAGNFELVYNGTQNALKRHFVAANLTIGTLYQFKVSTINFNGPSELSNALSVHACLVPGPASAPVRVTGIRDAIDLAW